MNVMNAMPATIRNGRIELDEQQELPEGTKLLVRFLCQEADHDSDEPNSPEEIARLLAASERLLPFDYTAEEEARIEEARQSRKAWELAHFDEHAEKLRRMWVASSCICISVHIQGQAVFDRSLPRSEERRVGKECNRSC